MFTERAQWIEDSNKMSHIQSKSLDMPRGRKYKPEIGEKSVNRNKNK